MTWPAKYRSLSFAITFAVVIVESALWAVPLGLALWLCGVGPAHAIVSWLLWISIAIALAIAAYAHLWRPALAGQTRRTTA
jgi:hypothetical protein